VDRVNARSIRIADVEHLLGDPQNTFDALGWRPQTSFDQLVQEMVEADLELAWRERVLVDAGIAHSLPGVGSE